MAHDAVLDDAVRRATAAVQTVAESPRNDMSGAAVAGAQPQLAAAITTAIAPVIANATNTEAWFFQKRSFWGAVGAGMALLSSVAGAVIPYMQSHTTDNGTFTASMLGIAFAAWGGYSSWKAGHSTTPLFTPEKPANPVAYRG